MFFSILHYRYRLPTSNVIGYIFLYLFLSLFLVSLRFFPAPLQRRSSVYIIPYEMSYPHLPFFSYKLFIFHPDILYSFTKHHFRAKKFLTSFSSATLRTLLFLSYPPSALSIIPPNTPPK